jgi:hypothetical protein
MHYKAPDNSLHWLDDDAFVHLLPVGSVQVTDQEAEALRPKPPELTYAQKRAAEYPPITRAALMAWSRVDQSARDDKIHCRLLRG